jgi:hypothetical protein
MKFLGIVDYGDGVDQKVFLTIDEAFQFVTSSFLDSEDFYQEIVEFEGELMSISSGYDQTNVNVGASKTVYLKEDGEVHINETLARQVLLYNKS